MEIKFDIDFEQIKKLFFQALERVNDIDREIFINDYTDHYCIHCGSKDSHCQCWNDE